MKEFKFKKVDGTIIEDVAKYVNSYIIMHPDNEFKLFIGTDSQRVRKRGKVYYATVLCLYKVGKGAHVIFSKTIRHDVRDIFQRLWWEVEYSMKLANLLRSSNILTNEHIMSIHLDLSPKIENESNSVYKAAIGYIKGMGFEYKAKPDSPASSYAADYFCRN